ncbi:MAG: UDP-N-acetylmuramoyl-L-alanyl-D-glutamate--2,6-diaminopimelate ligase [Gemmatimonadota bacterium]|nr:UDP-N-acetylmuramoyl-L-alanyl-D-glutamate--2,6-diaminopimelate ligase [Gemmatimonadota bacterium]MDE2985287.1 UDP-N-acetylmuramoyl-L-alanyl-D-glutamate--2,6-diaminopimelate ligase [Gemmatimonadota bacterium]
MSVSQVVAALEGAGVAVGPVTPARRGVGRVRVAGVQQDSRRVEPGDLFVAWSGAVHDAHDYVAGAADAGAAAAIVERPVPGASLPQIQVDNARLAAAVASVFVAGSPWRNLDTVGVTGTNGKTTTALLLRGLLGQRAPTAAIGTLGVTGPDGRVQEGTEGLTTPGPVQLSDWLSSLVRAGVSRVVLESSSHALDQFRLDGLRFDVAAFTNLTRDHLDYHGTLESYLAAKARLLELGRTGCTAVINADDPAWNALKPRGPVITYGLGPAALRALDVGMSVRGSFFHLAWNGRTVPVTLPLPGGFNVSNALCAAACALVLGHSLDDVADGLGEAAPVTGRLEFVVREPFQVLIDFAHTPDALEKVLAAVRPLVSGRVIVVFGAGGDRDPAKRPAMGAAVARYADLAVVTSDNPRTEDPATIIAQVSAGVSGCDSVEIVDRKEAIHRALDAAAPGDTVLLAGKGHEMYQVVGTAKRPFDERGIVLGHLEAGADR